MRWAKTVIGCFIDEHSLTSNNDTLGVARSLRHVAVAERLGSEGGTTYVAEVDTINEYFLNLNSIPTGGDVCDLKGESGGTVAHIGRLVILTEEPDAFRG